MLSHIFRRAIQCNLTVRREKLRLPVDGFVCFSEAVFWQKTAIGQRESDEIKLFWIALDTASLSDVRAVIFIQLQIRGLGGMPEWLKGTGCKPVGYAYVGSNPTPSTSAREGDVVAGRL